MGACGGRSLSPRVGLWPWTFRADGLSPSGSSAGSEKVSPALEGHLDAPLFGAPTLIVGRHSARSRSRRGRPCSAACSSDRLPKGGLEGAAARRSTFGPFDPQTRWAFGVERLGPRRTTDGSRRGRVRPDARLCRRPVPCASASLAAAAPWSTRQTRIFQELRSTGGPRGTVGHPRASDRDRVRRSAGLSGGRRPPPAPRCRTAISAS